MPDSPVPAPVSQPDPKPAAGPPPSPTANAPEPARWNLWLAPWRRFSRASILSVILLLLVGGLGMKWLVPPPPAFAPADTDADLLARANAALDAGEYARAYHWYRELDEKFADDADLDPAVRHLLLRGQLIAGYEAAIPRAGLVGDERLSTYLDTLFRAMASDPDARPLLNLFRTQAPTVRPVAERALRHLLMQPSLRGIARGSAGLDPTPIPGDQRQPLTPEETRHRLRAWFAFVRDSVAVIPDDRAAIEIRQLPQRPDSPGSGFFFDFEGERFFTAENRVATGEFAGIRWNNATGTRAAGFFAEPSAVADGAFVIFDPTSRDGNGNPVIVRELRWWDAGNGRVYLAAQSPAPEPFRYPLETLYEGRGRLAEVNWLLIDGMQEVADVFAVELELGPPSVGPAPSKFSRAGMGRSDNGDETTDGIGNGNGGESGEDGGALAVAETRMQRHPGPGRLVAVFAPFENHAEVYIFDAYAGVPLLAADGTLLDLYRVFAGRERLHPDLRRLLPYGQELSRLMRGRCQLHANPLLATDLAAFLHHIGVAIGPRISHRLVDLLESRGVKSIFVYPFRSPPDDDDGAGDEPFVAVHGPSALALAFPNPRFGIRGPAELDPAEAAVGAGLLRTPDLVQMLIDTYTTLRGVPAAFFPGTASGFPFSWHFATAPREWWIVGEMQAEWRAKAMGSLQPDFDAMTQRPAIQDNRVYRQRALDYRRPRDGGRGFENYLYDAFDLGRWADLAWPDANADAPAATPDGPAIVGRLIADAAGKLAADPPRISLTDAPIGERTVAVVEIAVPAESAVVIDRVELAEGADPLAMKVLADAELPLPVARVAGIAVAFEPVNSNSARAALRISYRAGDGKSHTLEVPITAEPREGHPVLGFPPALGGSALTVLAETMRRELPIVVTQSMQRNRAIQAWFGAGWCDYLVGNYEAAAMSFADFSTGFTAANIGYSLTDLPGSWRHLARFLHGRSMTALGRIDDANRSFEAIAETAPLGIAARVPHLLQPPTAYVTSE